MNIPYLYGYAFPQESGGHNTFFDVDINYVDGGSVDDIKERKYTPRLLARSRSAGSTMTNSDGGMEVALMLYVIKAADENYSFLFDGILRIICWLNTTVQNLNIV